MPNNKTYIVYLMCIYFLKGVRSNINNQITLNSQTRNVGVIVKEKTNRKTRNDVKICNCRSSHDKFYNNAEHPYIIVIVKLHMIQLQGK